VVGTVYRAISRDSPACRAKRGIHQDSGRLNLNGQQVVYELGIKRKRVKVKGATKQGISARTDFVADNSRTNSAGPDRKAAGSG